jgi:hypothetical protein
VPPTSGSLRECQAGRRRYRVGASGLPLPPLKVRSAGPAPSRCPRDETVTQRTSETEGPRIRSGVGCGRMWTTPGRAHAERHDGPPACTVTAALGLDPVLGHVRRRPSRLEQRQGFRSAQVAVCRSSARRLGPTPVTMACTSSGAGAPKSHWSGRPPSERSASHGAGR